MNHYGTDVESLVRVLVASGSAPSSASSTLHAWHPPYLAGAYGGTALPIGPVEEAAEQALDEAIGGLDARDLPVPIYRVTACGPPAR
jgi:hypothetical protein